MSLIQFAKKYRKFMILAIGCIAVSFTHILVNNFFIQIIKPIGGVLLDVISVSAVLLVGVASSIIGAGITFIF